MNFDRIRQEPAEQASGAQRTEPDGIDHQENGLSGVELPNRRSFMRRLLGHSAVAAEVVYMAAPLTYLWQASSSDEEPGSDLVAPSSHYTDTHHQGYGTAAFHNVGVIHTEEQFQRDKNRLFSAIDEADIVLLERGGYFERLAIEARDRGKEIACIDYYNLYKLEQSLARSPFIAAAAGGWLGLDYAASQFSESSDLTPKLRRMLARAAGYIHANTSFPSPQFAAHYELAPESYPASDLSFLVDGRTVKMLEHVERIAGENSDKKVLAITGDIHARGFDYYRQSSATRKLFEAKKAFYDVCYEGYRHSSS